MWLNNIYIRSELYFFKLYGPLCKIHSIQLKHFFPIQKGFRQRKIYFLNEWKKRGKKFLYSLTIKKKCLVKKSNFPTFCDFLIDSVLAFIFASPNNGILPSFLTITWKGWTQRTISVYWFATTSIVMLFSIGIAAWGNTASTYVLITLLSDRITTLYTFTYTNDFRYCSYTSNWLQLHCRHWIKYYY